MSFDVYYQIIGTQERFYVGSFETLAEAKERAITLNQIENDPNRYHHGPQCRFYVRQPK